MRALIAVAVVGLLSNCATLDSSKMSDSCRGLYNACLDTCPKVPQQQPGQLQALYIETSKCVDRCNDQAKSCEPH